MSAPDERSRSGHKRLLFWAETRKKIAQIQAVRSTPNVLDDSHEPAEGHTGPLWSHERGDQGKDRDSDIHIHVTEAYGEKRGRMGFRRLLFWKETEKSITQIDPMYPATVPIMNEGLYPVTLSKTEELNLRLMRYQKKFNTCGIMNFWKVGDGIKTGIIKGSACKKHFEKTQNIYKSHCGRPGCEYCGDSWAWRFGDRVKEDLMGYRVAYLTEGVKFPLYNHGVFSVPPKEYQHYADMIESNDTYPKLKKEMRKIIKFAGVKASAEIFHPYRFKHADGTTCEEMDCSKKHHIQFAPHWHLIYIGFLMQSDQFYRETGWVYKKIQNCLSPRKIKVVAHYLATHSGLLVGKESGKLRHNVVTYSGMIAPSKIRVVHRKEFIREECDICGGPKEYFAANIPLGESPLTIEHVRGWEGPVEYWGDRRYFYLPQTMREMEDYRKFCDHG